MEAARTSTRSQGGQGKPAPFLAELTNYYGWQTFALVSALEALEFSKVGALHIQKDPQGSVAMTFHVFTKLYLE